jgi:hypothetical protein
LQFYVTASMGVAVGTSRLQELAMLKPDKYVEMTTTFWFDSAPIGVKHGGHANESGARLQDAGYTLNIDTAGFPIRSGSPTDHARHLPRELCSRDSVYTETGPPVAVNFPVILGGQLF